MSDRHRNAKLGFRPSEDEVERAREQLDARGRPMGEYLRACLRAMAEDPEGMLATLAPVWPEPRPAGRPASAKDGAGSDEGERAGGG